MESAVTRLLVAIEQLLEALRKWSNQEATEGEVSDVYVRLGNDFNAAVAAFASYHIDMSFVRAPFSISCVSSHHHYCFILLGFDGMTGLFGVLCIV